MDKALKPITRRTVIAGGAAAVGTALIPVTAMATAPTFEEAVEALTLEMESWGYKFYVSFRGNKPDGLFIGLADVRYKSVHDFHLDLFACHNALWKEDSRRYKAKMVSMGRHNLEGGIHAKPVQS